MAKEIPSVGDLRRKSEVSDDEIEAAAAAYLKDEGAPPFVFKSGHTVDVAKAIEMHPQAKTAPGRRGDQAGLTPHDGEDRHRHGLPGPGMNAADQARQIAANRLMERLSGFVQGIGMNGMDAREIIDRVIAELPYAGDGEREAKARAWMLIALA